MFRLPVAPGAVFPEKWLLEAENPVALIETKYKAPELPDVAAFEVKKLLPKFTLVAPPPEKAIAPPFALAVLLAK